MTRDMPYFVMRVTDKVSGREFEYVYPGWHAQEVHDMVQLLYGIGYDVGDAVMYFGGNAPNVTPE